MPNYSTEQLKAGLQAANAAGDIESVNEIAALLDAQKASPSSVAGEFSAFQDKRRKNFTPPASMSPMSAYSQMNRLPIDEQTEAAGAVVRTAGPIVGSMVAPQLMPAMAPAISASLGGMAGSAVATAGMDMPMREKLSDLTLSSTPIKSGGGLKGAGINAASGYTTGTAANALQTGEFNPVSGQGLFGAAVPLTMGSIAGAGNAIRRGRAAAEGVKASRGTNSLLSEALPEYSKLESKVFHDGSNEILTRALSEADTGLAQMIKQRFPSIPDTSLMTGRLSQELGKLDAARKTHAKLLSRANRMKKALGKSRALGRIAHPQQARAASQAAIEATNAGFVAREGLEKLFNGNSPKFGGTGQGARMERIAEITKSADDSVSQSLDDLYKAADIGENDIVATLADTKQFFRAASARGKGLEGNAARKRVQSLVREAFDENGELSLEGFKSLRGRIAKELDGDAAFANDASRIAGAAYDVVSQGAGKTMSRTMPNKYTNWLDAQAFAAQNFKVRDAGVVQAMRNGDSEVLISRILKEGKGAAVREIDDYANLIARQSPEAAEAFRVSTNRVVRDGVIDSAMNRTIDAPALNTIDAGKLAQTLTAMRKNGFDIADIGFGDKDLVSALSRLSQGKNKQGFDIETIAQLADDVAGLGVSKAVAKVRYSRELRNYAIQRGLPEARKKAAYEMRNTQKARVSADTAFAEVKKLEGDDLIKLMENSNIKLSKDFASNAKWVDKLLTLDPSSVKKVMETLRSSNRSADADLIASTAVAKMFRGVLDGTGDALQVNRKAIEKAFLSDGSDAAMNSLKAMVGERGFNELNNNLISPLRRLYAATDDLAASGSGNLAIKPFVRTGVGQARFALPIEPILRWMRAGKYNTLYKAVVDPKYARHAKAAGYVLENIKDPATKTALLQYSKMDEGAPQDGR
jgi:hypothetical protein